MALGTSALRRRIERLEQRGAASREFVIAIVDAGAPHEPDAIRIGDLMHRRSAGETHRAFLDRVRREQALKHGTRTCVLLPSYAQTL